MSYKAYPSLLPEYISNKSAWLLTGACLSVALLLGQLIPAYSEPATSEKQIVAIGNFLNQTAVLVKKTSELALTTATKVSTMSDKFNALETTNQNLQKKVDLLQNQLSQIEVQISDHNKEGSK